MISLLFFPLMALTAETSRASAPCSNPQQVIGDGKVSTLAPDAQSLELELIAKGLQIGSAADVSWTSYSVDLQPRVYGGWAITSNGVPVIPVNNQLVTRDDTPFPPEPEPVHPNIPGARFVSSIPLMIGDHRAGLWIEAGGRSLIARYRPGSSDAPIPVQRSSKPILGLFYVGSRCTWWHLPVLAAAFR